ncbi:g7435 [Coccomyxa elongata]
MTLAVNILQESQEQAEHLQEFRTKNKEIVQENAGLRSKLAHALALLRMYQHKVQILDAAASHQEAARPNANTASQSQLTWEQSNGKECSASEASCGVYEGYFLQNSSKDTETEPDPPPMQEKETCLGGQCSDSHRAAGGPTEAAAQGQDSPAALPAISDSSSSAQDPAFTQTHVLRFDPILGECGAFFIVRGGETCADGLIASPGAADAAPSQRRSAGQKAVLLPAGEKAHPPHTVLDELEEAPRQVPALPQPYKGSRSGTWSSWGQGNAQSNPELDPSQNRCSPTKTEPSSCSRGDTSSKRSGGSLMDLVAEVEQLLGQGSDTACHNGSSCSHGGAAFDISAHAQLAGPMQDGCCQQWIGKLVSGKCRKG